MRVPLRRKLKLASLSLGHIFRAWRGNRVVSIPKAGRAGFTRARDVRPNSLITFFLKSIESFTDTDEQFTNRKSL